MARLNAAGTVLGVLACGLGLGAPAPVHAQAPGADAPPMPLREFRGLWVATVANIDWPSKPGLPLTQLRSQMLRILDVAAACNLNALILQVRPSCDAMYPSMLEPWSEFLTGQSGTPPADAAYDPLAEWINAAHARGIELHAWINPFRARHVKSTQPDAQTHISKTRPDLIRTYDGYLWLDPGEPAAQAHTLAVIEDLTRRYDIDGLHLDDYFYPYPKKGEVFADSGSFARSGAGHAGATTGVEDWRRENINTLLQTLHASVKGIKPFVRVGISPFGIWRPGHPPQVKGFDAYDGLYADARLWLREGWVDYLAPQLYWKLDAPEQPFARLLDWWIDQRGAGDTARPVWPGLYATRINDTAQSWHPTEILNQIATTRDRSPGGAAGGNAGVILYSAIGLVENRKGLADALRAGPFAEPAMVPPSPWPPPSGKGERGPLTPAPPVALPAPLEPGPVTVAVRAAGTQLSVAVSAAPTRVPVAQARRCIIWTRSTGGAWRWQASPIGAAAMAEQHLPAGAGPEQVIEVAAASVDRFGRLGPVARVPVAPPAR